MSFLLKQALEWSVFRPLLVYGVLFYILFHLTRKFLQARQLTKIVDRIPGPKSSLNPLGHIYMVRANGQNDLITNFFDAICGLTKVYEHKHSLIRFWLAHTPLILFFKADAAEKIFSSNVHIQKSVEYELLQPWLGTGLLTSSGKKWFQRRKMLTPAFHFNILEAFLPAMNEQSQVLVTKIRQQVIESQEKGAVLDVVPYITYAALDIICETAMGLKIASQSNPNNDYVMAIHRVGSKMIKRVLRPWLWSNFVYYNFSADGREDKVDLSILHNFTMKVIKERKKEALEQKSEVGNENEKIDSFTSSRRRLAFLDMLIEQHLKDPETLNEVDMREEVDTFMFEGHDTTAMSMIWTLFLLGHHPEYQERVQQEIDEIWERDQVDDSKFLNSNQLREMKFLEACIKESLRLFPSVPFIARVASTDIPHENYVIPKGSTLFLFLHMIHRDPKLFKQPYSFIPNRFIEGSQEYVKNPFAYVPFSAGARNCIGQKFALQEEKVLLATVLRHYRLQSQKHLDKILMHPELVIRPKEPIDIRFIPRH